ncbi:MAG TPA: high-potential iron-sulfur protein [Rudaea sp.]|nr:high-potential iron-sulfur protein [Rudaea sp.]
MPNYSKCSRREAAKRIVGIAALLASTRFATAAELPHLTDANPSAAALGYTEDSTTVDERKFPKHRPGQRCANCKYFHGDAGLLYGACNLYQGNAVNAQGWCAGYIAA